MLGFFWLGDVVVPIAFHTEGPGLKVTSRSVNKQRIGTVSTGDAHSPARGTNPPTASIQ